MNASRRWIRFSSLLIVGLLASCSTFSSKKPRVEPAPLTNFKPSLTVRTLWRADLGRAGFVDIRGAQSLRKHLAHGRLDAPGGLVFVERIAQHHRRRQDSRQRIGQSLARDIRGGAMDRFV